MKLFSALVLLGVKNTVNQAPVPDRGLGDSSLEHNLKEKKNLLLLVFGKVPWWNGQISTQFFCGEACPLHSPAHARRTPNQCCVNFRKISSWKTQMKTTRETKRNFQETDNTGNMRKHQNYGHCPQRQKKVLRLSITEWYRKVNKKKELIKNKNMIPDTKIILEYNIKHVF